MTLLIYPIIDGFGSIDETFLRVSKFDGHFD